MENVNISEFRANLLKYLTQAKEGKEINVTSHGEVLATISPPVEKSAYARARLQELSRSAHVGDILSPTDEEWDAAR